MISLKKNDFDTFTKMPNNVGNLCKIIVATGFEWWPKVQKIAKSGHTGHKQCGQIGRFSWLLVTS